MNLSSHEMGTLAIGPEDSCATRLVAIQRETALRYYVHIFPDFYPSNLQ